MAKNDSIVLGMQVDVNKAFNLLSMFEEAGKDRIDIRTLLDEAAPKIVEFRRCLEKLKPISENKTTGNFSEFAGWLGVSRQTVSRSRAGTARRSERGTDAEAGDDGMREQAQVLE